jgi:hypothetical protein
MIGKRLARRTKEQRLLSETWSQANFRGLWFRYIPCYLLDLVGSPSRTRTCDHSINSRNFRVFPAVLIFPVVALFDIFSTRCQSVAPW